MEYTRQCNALMEEHVKWRKGRDCSEWGNVGDGVGSTGSLFVGCQEQYLYILTAYSSKIPFNPDRTRGQKPQG